jgi:hypothetical protein
MGRTVGLIGFLLISGCFTLLASDQGSERVLERFKTLAGDWEGTYQWSNGRTDSGSLKATYYVTGNGSAVVENLIMGDPPTPMMTTVYHRDGADLRMTHYCATKNQPRLKAAGLEENATAIDFTFVDVTNARLGPAYVNACHIDLSEPNRINLKFTFGGGTGKGAIENISLKRVTAASS